MPLRISLQLKLKFEFGKRFHHFIYSAEVIICLWNFFWFVLRFNELFTMNEQNQTKKTSGTPIFRPMVGYENASSQMSLADWRWAATRGYWNPLLRCWNEAVGGKSAYLLQRDEGRDKRRNRRPRADKVFSSVSELASCISSGNEFSLSRDPLLLTFISKHGWDQLVGQR